MGISRCKTAVQHIRFLICWYSLFSSEYDNFIAVSSKSKRYFIKNCSLPALYYRIAKIPLHGKIRMIQCYNHKKRS